LEIQTRFVFRQKDRVGGRLGLIDQFFSSCSSKSATFSWLCDL
jgi:hypothetical protein